MLDTHQVLERISQGLPKRRGQKCRQRSTGFFLSEAEKSLDFWCNH